MTLLNYAPVWMTIDTHRHEVYSAPVPTGRCLLICTHADDADAAAALLTFLSDPDSMPGHDVAAYPARIRHAIACAIPPSRGQNVFNPNAGRGRPVPVMYGDPEARRACVAIPPGYTADAALDFLGKRAGSIWCRPYFVAV